MAADGKFGMNTDCDFYKLDYETLAVTPYAVYGEAIGSSVGCDVRHGGGQAFKMDGDVLYFISTRFDGAGLYKLEDGTVSPVGGPGSHLAVTAAAADLLIEIETDATELAAGTEVTTWPLT